MDQMAKKDDYGFNLIGNMVKSQLKDSQAQKLFKLKTNFFEDEIKKFEKFQEENSGNVCGNNFSGRKKYKFKRRFAKKLGSYFRGDLRVAMNGLDF